LSELFVLGIMIVLSCAELWCCVVVIVVGGRRRDVEGQKEGYLSTRTTHLILQRQLLIHHY
jgi:hypothetical protein